MERIWQHLGESGTSRVVLFPAFKPLLTKRVYSGELCGGHSRLWQQLQSIVLFRFIVLVAFIADCLCVRIQIKIVRYGHLSFFVKGFVCRYGGDCDAKRRVFCDGVRCSLNDLSLQSVTSWFLWRFVLESIRNTRHRIFDQDDSWVRESKCFDSTLERFDHGSFCLLINPEV